MTRYIASTVAFAALLLACHESSGGLDLPEIVASSKYIDYSPLADTSVICMDDTLAREDRFIEDVAAFLGVDLPSGRIRYIWEPALSFDAPRPEECGGEAFSCYDYLPDDNGGLIHSMSFFQEHELVHATDVPALGVGHATLVEGLADYLGSFNSSESVLEGFPEAFRAMVARSPKPDDYRLAMHFVGSLLLSHGVEKYKELRKALPADGDLAALEAAFEAVYGETLSAALVTMNVPIQGVLIPTGCADGELLAWTAPGLLETTLHGECGDGSFIGPGFTDGRTGFAKPFAVEILDAGYYSVTVSGLDPLAEQPSYALIPCPDVESGLYSGAGGLYPGRYYLAVGFPAGPAARGDAKFKLEFTASFGP